METVANKDTTKMKFFILKLICKRSNDELDTKGRFMQGTIHKRRLPKGGGRGVQKMPKKETFTSRFEETRGGRVPQKSKIWGDVFYGWSLTKTWSDLSLFTVHFSSVHYGMGAQASSKN